MSLHLASTLFLALASSAGPAEEEYLVLVAPGAGEQFLPAAEAMAALHHGALRRFNPAALDQVLAHLQKSPPRSVVLILPPEAIDVDFSHAVLEMATQVDDDPFADFEYGFVTGRDGEAALRFVRRIEAAHQRDFGRKGVLFGSWEGPVLPPDAPPATALALGLDLEDRYVKTADPEATRGAAARQALTTLRGMDFLLFFSHGYPDAMASCFRASDLRKWQVDLSPAILFNCACYNGAPGRWYLPGADGRFEDRGLVSPDASVALAILDSGVSGYFAGIDPWHGPLTNQLFLYVMDDGCRLGRAAKWMWDRLALEFLPERIHYPPTADVVMQGEGRENRRRNGAGMILYGDPALAPFEDSAPRLLSAEIERRGEKGVLLSIRMRPLVEGFPGPDFMLAQARLMDYYSVKTSNVLEELAMEVYRVVPLPPEAKGAPTLAVVKATSGSEKVPTGDPVAAVEESPWGRFLHVRVPITARMFGSPWLLTLARQGLEIELAGKW